MRPAIRHPALLLGALAAALLLASARPARCEVSLTLSLDRTEATPADSVLLTVSVSGAHGEAARPTIEGLEEFLVRPAGTSTRVEIVNGRYSAGTDFSFVLQPRRAGSFRIGPAQVVIDGAAYRSEAATLAVGQPAASPDGARGPVFLAAALTPAKVYAEQQALYTLKLYRTLNIADVSVTVPEATGIAFAKLGEPREYQSTLQGRAYKVIEVRYLVTPQKAGSYTLAPTRMDLTVFEPRGRSRRGIFDDPFFAQRSAGKTQALLSESLPLQVLPLPGEGRPADFSGLVGSFTLESTLEPRQLRAGESATLTAVVRGRGNARRIPELKIPALDGLKIYADQPVLKEENDGEGVLVAKTLKWALVPERAGRFAIPALELSYFDATAGRYRTLKSGEATLAVSPGGADAAASARSRTTGAPAEPPAKRAVAEVGSDILPVHADIGSRPSGLAALPGPTLFWLLLAGPPLAYLLAFGGALARRSSGSLAAALSMRTAANALVRACKREGLTFDELMQALQDYLSQRLGLPRGSRTADDAAALLRARRVGDAAAGQLHEIWRRVEDAIYTGRGRETTDAGAGLARLVARIEKELR